MKKAIIVILALSFMTAQAKIIDKIAIIVNNRAVTYHQLEKIYQAREVIFEYAVCESCKSEMNGQISAESLVNLADYFMDHYQGFEQREPLLKTFDNSIHEWINECIFTGTLRSECQDFQLCAECAGDQLTVSFMPFMVSGHATEEIQSLLSEETQKSFRRFSQNVLNPPADVKNLPVFI